MFKVLVVDDERNIREGIRKMIDWESTEFVFEGAAQNGIEARDMIKNLAPDIVITDIKMPGMDGLELIENVNSQIPRIVFIILSGYDEFNFARAAMKYGVRHYLLKPTDEEEILKVLREASLEVMQRREMDRFAEKTGKKYKRASQSHSSLINAVIDNIYGNIHNEKLSLKWLAGEIMYMNSHYLGKQFYTETGEKFSHFVMRVRMEKAVELIETEEYLKIYEVALKVGFGNNSQYFSSVFKKFTGFTPSEYKEKL